MKEDDDSEDDDEFDKDKLSHKPSAILNQDWQRIHDAISEVSEDQDLAKLTHPALNIFVFKRRPDGEVITRYVVRKKIDFYRNPSSNMIFHNMIFHSMIFFGMYIFLINKILHNRIFG